MWAGTYVHGSEHLPLSMNAGPQVKKAYRIQSEGLVSGEVQPLPYRIFESDQVENAMRYLTKGTVTSSSGGHENEVTKTRRLEGSPGHSMVENSLLPKEFLARTR